MQHEYSIAKVGFDTGESGPREFAVGLGLSNPDMGSFLSPEGDESRIVIAGLGRARGSSGDLDGAFRISTCAGSHFID